jgi:hypothetical protein
MPRLIRLLLLIALSGVSYAQTLTNVTASHISISGTPIAAGTVLLTPVNSDGKPIAFVTGGGGGLNAPKAFSCTITAGALSGCQVPDSAATTPANLLYTIDVTDTATSVTFRLPTVPNITGTSWALDAYAPSAVTTTSQPLQVTYGTTAPPNPCATGFYYQTQNSVGLYVCVGGTAVPVGSASLTASAMAGALASQTGCTTAGNAWNPATNTCVAAGASKCPFVSASSLCLTDSAFGAVGNGVHDDTPAFLAAVAAIAALPQKTGVITLPDGVYLVAGGLLDTTGANAIIPMPKLPNYTSGMVDIAIRGLTQPNWDNGLAGAVIKATATTGNLFGGFDSAAGGGFPGFTNAKLRLDSVTMSGPCNGGLVFVNATNLLAFSAQHVLINTPCAGSVPTNTASGGIFMPAIGNEVQNYLDDIQIGGIYTPYKLTEHTHAGSIHAVYGHNCFVFDNGNTSASVGNYEGNGVQIDHLWEQNCVNDIVGGAGPFHSALNISLADLENTTGNGVLDASNILYGIANINVANSSGSLTPCNANVSGAIHLTIHYLNCQPEVAVSSGPPSGLIENWASQDGSGTTLANTGSDSTNSMTTNATWATATGFTGNVATYNGTSSLSTAASATNTSFNGTQPFSACFWTTPSSFTGLGEQYPLTNLLGTPLGWGIEIWGSNVLTGSVNVQIYGNGTNYIAAHTAAGAVTASTLNHVCMTYSGSGVASGIAVYVNGAASALTVVTDNLAGHTTASANPVTIGSAYNGAIGRVRIFNRLLSASEVSAMYVAGPNAY